VLLAVLALCTAADGSEPERKPAVTEHVQVFSVSVPVQVTLQGEPVRGLTVDNFRLFDRGKRQEITGFEVIDLEVARQAEERNWDSDIPIAGRRHFLVVFDLSFARPQSIKLARAEIRKWTAQSLDPTDLVAVATYSVARGPRLLLSFTSDRDQVVQAVDNLGALDLSDKGTDPLAISSGAVADESLSTMGFARSLEYGFSTDSGSDAYSNLQRDTYLGATQRVVDQERRQPIARMSRTFGYLARMMRSVEGRKYVVYLSEGFDSSLIFADHSTDRILRANESLETGELWTVDSARRFGHGPTQASIHDMLDEFREADCVIQAVDLGKFRNPHGTRTVPTFTESLLLMANHTGGALYRDYDDVGAALDQMLRATSVTYMLWFTPQRTKTKDGAFHDLKVKLHEVPNGAKVSHRAGYHVPTPLQAQNGEELRLSVGQMILGGEDGGSLATSVLAEPFRLEADRSLLPVLVEVDGLSLTGNRRSGQMSAEIYSYAFDSKGALADFFTQTVQLDLDRIGPFLRQHGLKFYGELELPVGEYSLRTLVLDRSSGTTGLTVSRIVVPEYDSGPPVVLAPLFPEARGRWLLVREARLEDRTEPSRFPFLVGIDPYLPAAAPSLPVDGGQLLYVPTYNLTEGPTALWASVSTFDGRPVHDVELPLIRRGPGGPDGAELLVTRLSAANLERGRYNLIVTVVDAAGEKIRSRAIPFDVVGS
jgi:VWFA-related protein